MESEKLLPSIHPAYARLISMQLKRMGVSMDALFSGLSVSWDALVEGQSFVSFEQFSALYTRATTLVPDKNLPTEVSNIVQISAHGSLGYGALAARCLAEAFLLIKEVLATRIGFIKLDYQPLGEYAEIRIRSDFDIAALSEFLPVMLLGSLLDLIDKCLGELPVGIEVEMPFDEPEWADDFLARYPVLKVRYGYPSFVVRINNDLLFLPSLTADEFAYRSAEQECKQILRQVGGEGKLSRHIRKLLLDSQPSFPTQAQVCEQLNMSIRTFIRRLKNEGTSYQTLVDEVRREIASWLIRDKSLSVERVAERLGYQDTSNFSRVFKRWFNDTPSAYRKRL